MWLCQVLPSGLGVWVRYRLGVDSIWTGLGLPSEETGLEERLGLTTIDHNTATSSSSSSSKKKDKKQTTKEKEGGVGSKRGTRGAKDLRRAYYRKSLQWHPDRWATMPNIYLPGRLEPHLPSPKRERREQIVAQMHTLTFDVIP